MNLGWVVQSGLMSLDPCCRGKSRTNDQTLGHVREKTRGIWNLKFGEVLHRKVYDVYLIWIVIISNFSAYRPENVLCEAQKRILDPQKGRCGKKEAERDKGGEHF